ncbi:MAG: hypothetical protein JWM64_1153 [Frankiales bacterium]|nr:hypothetical protein [Frankiales bacterium]
MTRPTRPCSLSPRGVLLAIGLAVLGSSAGAFAGPGDVEVTYGWWTASAPAPVPAGPGLPVGPDAPADGMVVQGGAPEVGEVAYGAVSFSYDRGAKATALRLAVVPGAGSVGGALRACAVLGGVVAAQGAPASQGPSFDCTRSSTASLKDGAYTFDVGGLSGDGEVSVALVAENPATRVVFAKPVAEALRLTLPTADVAAGAVGGAVTQPEAAAAAGAGSGPVPAPAAQLDAGALVPAQEPAAETVDAAPPSVATADLPGGDLPAADPVVAEAPAAPAAAAPLPEEAAPVDEVALSSSAVGDGPHRGLGLLAGAAALLAAGLWTVASSRAGLEPAAPDA